jgi:hypothetical protein
MAAKISFDVDDGLGIKVGLSLQNILIFHQENSLTQ